MEKLWKKDDFLDHNILTGEYLSIIESYEFKRLYVKILFTPKLQKELLRDYIAFSKHYGLDLTLVRPMYWIYVQNIKK